MKRRNDSSAGFGVRPAGGLSATCWQPLLCSSLAFEKHNHNEHGQRPSPPLPCMLRAGTIPLPTSLYCQIRSSKSLASLLTCVELWQLMRQGSHGSAAGDCWGRAAHCPDSHNIPGRTVCWIVDNTEWCGWHLLVFNSCYKMNVTPSANLGFRSSPGY